MARRDAWLELLAGLEWAIARRTDRGQIKLNPAAIRDLKKRGLCASDPPGRWESFLRAAGDLAIRESGLLIWQPLPAPASNRSSIRAPLTPREREVRQWLRTGKRPDEIAGILGCTRRTVQKHQQNLYRKLGVSRLSELLWQPDA
ncbi:helix-turn-helix transcriptional regulator [Synoicihabitans lomoniglobus]|uniref:Helix-turn-helix domain-containing protein n=1 Tax=Synoicihabitans lomoniglobus TaxID=2909285 RepID=A0AAE9ZVT8_9BACT|nr:helix-turn-helix domain-containing protein [Opitutaceae bacterium LMO-M01]WED64331.1 helix-turn-helix domain-containing protein [Opitutaceae bacterium LMO-M01]